MPSELKAIEEYRAWGRPGELERDSVTILDNTQKDRLLVEVCTDGNSTVMPKLYCKLPQKKLAEKYIRLRGKLRVSSCYSIQDTKISFAITNCTCEDSDDTVGLGEVNCEQGVWKEFSLSLKSTGYSDQWLELTFEDSPISLDHAHKRYLEVRELKLETDKAYRYFFDGFGYNSFTKTADYTPDKFEIETTDGLSISLNSKGSFGSLAVDGNVLSNNDGDVASGFMIKDASQNKPPQLVKSKVFAQERFVFLNGNAGNIDVDVKIQAHENRIEFSGLLKNKKSTEKMITLYFAMPLINGSWIWGDDINNSFLANSETNFIELKHENHYPMSSMALQQKGGISFAVRMDEPVMYRIVYNRQFKLYYIAMDFTLLPLTNVNGKDMSATQFSFVIYKNDPAWGFRSALARYYDFYPYLFTNRVDNPGGWGIWRTNDNPPEDYLDDGFRFSWGGEVSLLRWHKDHGVYNLLYLEPEHYQLSMGDYTNSDQVTPKRVMDRLEKLGKLDEKELANYRKLARWEMYFTDEQIKSWHSYDKKEDYWKAILTATSRSVIYNFDGLPEQTIAGNRAWLGDSNIGSMLSCNLDPDIPGGRGWFNTEITYNNQVRSNQQKKGFDIDGFALDCFLTLTTPNFRKEHFKYADLPLSFEYCKGKAYPMIPKNFSTIEWVKDLRDKFPGKLTMANLTCCNNFYYLTFAAPYIDIYGVEDRRVGIPEYLRAMAYRKPITDLPYKPREMKQVKKQMLYTIFQGDGHGRDVMKKYFPVIRKLHDTGWQPIPYARTKAKDVIIERYSNKNDLFLVIHNGKKSVDAVTVLLEKELNVNNGIAQNMLEEINYNIKKSELKINIEAEDTIAIKIVSR